MNPETNELFQAVDKASDALAALTGLKRQLVEDGWDERNAEQMIIVMVHGGGSQ